MKMSMLEKKLLDAAFRGEWAGSPSLPIISKLFIQEEADITVRGVFLRELLLGLHTPAADMVQNARLHGVRLRGAIIKGEIDLSDMGVDGAPLPSLLLEHCIIYGDVLKYSIIRDEAVENKSTLRAINASNTRFSRLSLNGCQIAGRIDLTDATLNGDLEFNDLVELGNDCCCQIFARRCRIDGSVIAQRARLWIVEGQYTEFDVADYALNLVDANIRGSIMLQPNFYADGGINVSGAQVGGNIWAEAARFEASSEIAFQAQSLQCAGTVALRGKESEEREVRPCEVLGELDFLGATIGFLDLRGIHIRRRRNLKESAADRAVLNLYLVRVRDNFWLSNLFSGSRTIIEGSIYAEAMTVGGDWELKGLILHLPSDYKYPGITAANLHIGGNLKLDRLNTAIDLTSSHVERNLNVDWTMMEPPDNCEYGLVARNITIGNDCILEAVAGTIDLELSRIGGALIIHAKNLAALNAKNSEVRGSVAIGGQFRPRTRKQQLYFDGGTYLSGFYIGDPNSKNQEFNSLGFLDIQNDFLPTTEHTGTKGNRLIPTFSIQDARIENDFWVTEVWVAPAKATQYKFIEAQKASLSFYAGWNLVETLFQLESGSKAIVAFLQNKSGEPVLLSGQSATIHELNRRGMLHLDSEQKVREYLRFFCAYVWGRRALSSSLNPLKPLAVQNYPPQ